MTIDLLGHIRADSARFLDVLARTDPTTPVPTCPEWTAADLLWHLGEVQRSWGMIVRDRLADFSAYEADARPDRFEDLLEFFTTSSALLCDALADTDDDVAVWTWLETNQTVGFVRRRQAHEALIHRLDAELTSGSQTDLDPVLATDGVLEALDWIHGGAPEWATVRRIGQIGRLSSTDTGAEWLVEMASWDGTGPESGTAYRDEPAFFLVGDGVPSFQVAGTSANLDAWLWNRPTQGSITFDGDASALEAVLRAGVQ